MFLKSKLVKYGFYNNLHYNLLKTEDLCVRDTQSRHGQIRCNRNAWDHLNFVSYNVLKWDGCNQIRQSKRRSTVTLSIVNAYHIKQYTIRIT